MSEMVERVARALCAADGLDWSAQANPLTSGGGGDDEQEGYRDKARAAIEAMREPTEAQAEQACELTALRLPGGRAERLFSPAEAKTAYRAMIDAALKEPA